MVVSLSLGLVGGIELALGRNGIVVEIETIARRQVLEFIRERERRRAIVMARADDCRFMQSTLPIHAAIMVL